MSSIQQFYKKQTIFLTGATGFLGKLIIEKLLRTCYDVEKIYILVRPKYNKSQEERFKDIFEQPCFDLLRDLHPDFYKKIHLVNGDCSQSFLGLNEDIQTLLKNEVTCVIHAAANVKFDTDLKTAVYTNVRSVRDLLHLAKDMVKLRAFVYVSTAFSHCCRQDIHEEFYDVDIKPEKLLKIVDVMDDKTLDAVTPFILGKWPNTYVYSKAIAEEVIRSYKQVLPIAIVRPAIVISTSESPIKGWIDNFHGVVGAIIGGSLGVLRTIQLDRNVTARLVPADHVVSTIVTAAWDVDKLKSERDTIPIYNFTGHKDNLITWGNMIDGFMNLAFEYPVSAAVWYYCVKTTRYKPLYKFYVFFLHTLFSYFVDGILLLVGKRPIAVEKYKKINKLTESLAYFSTRSWNFNSTNVDRLWEKMSGEDRQLFNFDMEHLDWNEYFKVCAIGGRIYLMKDPLETLPQAKRKIYILAVIHYTFIALLVYLLYKVLSPLLNVFF